MSQATSVITMINKKPYACCMPSRYVLGMSPDGTSDLLSALRRIFESEQFFCDPDQGKGKLVHCVFLLYMYKVTVTYTHMANSVSLA